MAKRAPAASSAATLWPGGARESPAPRARSSFRMSAVFRAKIQSRSAGRIGRGRLRSSGEDTPRRAQPAACAANAGHCASHRAIVLDIFSDRLAVQSGIAHDRADRLALSSQVVNYNDHPQSGHLLHRLIVQAVILADFDPVGASAGSIHQLGNWRMLHRHNWGVFTRH